MEKLFIPTPLVEASELSPSVQSRVFLKMEALQPSGSFKNRGIGVLCTHYAQKQHASLFVTSSGGNAGLAVAYSGRLLQIPVKVVVPQTTASLMVQKIQREGAEVMIHGPDWDSAHALAKTLSQESGCFYIPPFDHPLIWQGHASMMHEMRNQGFKPDAIVLAVGGGGLLCGVLQGMHDLGWDKVPVYTAETEGAASFAQSVEAGRLVTLDKIATLATSLGAKTVARKALEWSLVHPIHPGIVSDKEAIYACLKFADQQRLLVEPACGAALALLEKPFLTREGYSKILVIVCGGSGVTRALLEEWRIKVGLS